MIRDPSQINQAFLDKVKFIEDTTSAKDFFTYFEMQVGPKDAETIIKQMEAFFTSGYYQAVRDITSIDLLLK